MFKVKISPGGGSKESRRGSSSWMGTNSNNELIKALVDVDGKTTLHEMVEQANLSKTTLYMIIIINLERLIGQAFSTWINGLFRRP